jgi:hypothetical protein
MKSKLFLSILFIFFAPLSAFSDSLEVRRDANVYEKPSRHSKRVHRIDLKDHEGPYLVQLLQDSRKNGYYKIRIPGQNKSGWIYKSYVRRHKGQHPKYKAYKRSLYVHWIDEDGDCQNTRAEALIRDDDDGRVKFRGNKECVVDRGTWLDSYTGKTFREAKKVDVDHVVPLKNAHESGAWAWSRERRREYANFLRDKNHLLAVSASENRKKGAKGPDKYMPPLKSYHCEYVRIWIKIKEDWELNMTEAEGETVQKILENCP